MNTHPGTNRNEIGIWTPNIDAMKTANTIKNALVCDKCHRIQVIHGAGYWCKIKRLSSLTSVVVDVTRCWRCDVNTDRDVGRNLMTVATMNSIIAMIKNAIGLPSMINLDYMSESPCKGWATAEIEYGSLTNDKFATRSMGVITSGIDYSHRCYSINAEGVRDAHRSFLRHGIYPTSVDEYHHTPFNCTTAAICYSCKRSIVCESMGTFHCRGVWMYKTDHMSEIIITLCCACRAGGVDPNTYTTRDENMLADSDEYESLLDMMSENTLVLASPNMRPNGLMNASKIMSPILNHCTAWSMDPGLNTPVFPHSDFLTNEITYLPPNMDMIANPHGSSYSGMNTPPPSYSSRGPTPDLPTMTITN